MATTRFIDHLLEGDHASRPAASAVPQGTLYSCTTHSLIYQSDGTSTWSTWATLGGGGLSDPMTTRGDIIVRNASNVTARLAIGSSGKVLSSDGTDVSWQTPASSGALVLLEQHTASSSSTLPFSSFISSTYDTYFFTFTSIVLSTNADFVFQVGTGGGPTYDTGGNYSYETFVWRAGAVAQSGATAQTAVAMSWQVTDDVNAGAGALNGLNGEMYLFDPQNTSLYRQVHGRTSYYDTSPFRVSVEFAGKYETTTALTAVRFLPSAGNITSGTIRVYGLAKS